MAPHDRGPVWADPRLRSLVVQALAIAAVLALAWFIFDNTLDNLGRRGIRTGFGFLGDTAGFGILMSLIPYSEASSYGRAFLVGLLNTLLVSAIGIVLATLLGFIVGLARLSSNWLVARLADTYVETLRNIPLLLQIFFWYFAVLRTLPLPRQSLDLGGLVFFNNRGLYLPAPAEGTGGWWVAGALATGVVAAALLLRWGRARRDTGTPMPGLGWLASAALIGPPLIAAAATGFGLNWDVPTLRGFNFRGGVVLIPEFVALTAALATYTAAYIAEVVRAGVISVPRGQVEAAQALGLSQSQTTWLIVVPQALRVIVPPLTNQYLNLTKNSSLAAAIAYPDLVSVFAGTVLNQTGQAVVVIGITMAVYLSLSLSISLAMNWYNRRVSLVER